MDIITQVELLRIDATSKLDSKKKSSLGQFFTPAPICQYMASLFNSISGNIQLLEPGCGVGSLLSAFVDRAIQSGVTNSIIADLYEIDEIIYPYLNETVGLCKQKLNSFVANVKKSDFVVNTVTEFSGGLFGKNAEIYTHVIMNPPYKKISTTSKYRKAFRQFGIETVNLYSGFVALAIQQLKPGGELVAIIPRSFCNGAYYLAFREFLLAETAIQHIHLFEKRNDAFSDNQVLQENIIFHCIKGKKPSEVIISSSLSSDFHIDENSGEFTATDLTIRKVDFDQIVNPNDKDKFIHIAASPRDQAIIDRLSSFKSTLKELELDVSTGPVVDFRLKTDLRRNYSKGDAPLLYPVHINGSVKWPVESKKPNAIKVSETSKPWLWLNKGEFVLVRRFSSKEEKRRIVASIYDGSLPGKLIGFENKLNVFHLNKSGISPGLAKGLYVYLNSSLLDKYYRQFSGHTQINATDLRNIHYPDKNTLIQLGKDVKENKLSQEEIDKKLEDIIQNISITQQDNPLSAQNKIDEALEILVALGMPKAQQNERSALTLLALLGLEPEMPWKALHKPLLGVTPIMDWCGQIYGKTYAPNTRETFRRQTLHQFVDGGIALYNPDKPDRPVNSPKACYQIVPELGEVLRSYSTQKWHENISDYLKKRQTLIEQYAKVRDMKKIALKISENNEIKLTPGKHSKLIRDIVNEFAPRFVPGSELIYVGDTGNKIGYFQKHRLKELGVSVDSHGKMPDIVLYYPEKDWLLLIESVTSHGPVDGKRHNELSNLFANSKAGLVYVTAFPDRKLMAKYLPYISWETEVWTADAPTHMIHFNGHKFIGPYS